MAMAISGTQQGVFVAATSVMQSHKPKVAVIGAGPSGLMAADLMSQAGCAVDIYDCMASVGRKFLLAGIGGLNITHSESYNLFCSRFADRQPSLQPMLDAFTPPNFRDWVHALGVETFVGSSGRVFPKEMKAAPLLRAWLHRLRNQGVQVHVRHRWMGWDLQNRLLFNGPQGDVTLSPHATVLALGGASWPKLGSDGQWVGLLQQRGVEIAPLEGTNCGFESQWTDFLKTNWAGSHIKNVAVKLASTGGGQLQREGELIVTQYGLEGSLIYAFSREIRMAINSGGQCNLTLDLMPGKALERVQKDLGQQRGGHPLAKFLKARLGLSGIKVALLKEVLGKTAGDDLAELACVIKALPITLTKPRPIEEAISTAGGVRFESLTSDLMLKAIPGTFVAGEMLDWEAPTGGYLLTACMATGKAAAKGVLNYLAG